MANQRMILVTGATGAQGGSVASHLLAGRKFAVRWLTRKPDSERAVALRRAGAEVLKGDLGDPASLREAMKGCYGVFGVTNYWEHFDGEFQHGKNLIDAVAASGIRHFVFSTLPHAKKLSGAERDVPRLRPAHFSGNGTARVGTRESGHAVATRRPPWGRPSYSVVCPAKERGPGWQTTKNDRLPRRAA